MIMMEVSNKEQRGMWYWKRNKKADRDRHQILLASSAMITNSKEAKSIWSVLRRWSMSVFLFTDYVSLDLCLYCRETYRLVQYEAAVRSWNDEEYCENEEELRLLLAGTSLCFGQWESVNFVQARIFQKIRSHKQ